MSSASIQSLMLLALLTICGWPSFATEGPSTDASTLIQRARQLSDIRSNKASPFHLKVAFKQYDGAAITEGIYSEMWLGSSRWRRDVTVGTSSRTEVDNEGQRWISGDDDLPNGASEIARLLDLTNSYSPGMKLTPVRSTDLQGSKAQCTDTKAGEEIITFCFDGATGVLLQTASVEQGEAPSICRYEQYEKFADQVFPRMVVCEQDGKPTLEARVLELSADASPDASVLLPQKPESTNPDCAGVMKPPQPMQKPLPAYPAGQPPGGTVTVGFTVEADGSLSNIRIVGSLGPEFDKPAMEAVKQWVFKPATCDGKAVATTVNVEVNFIRPY